MLRGKQACRSEGGAVLTLSISQYRTGGAMQRVPSVVNIDGYDVHTGATVQVMWLGVWYEGTVVKIGPKRNLCRVYDVSSKETVLLERKHLKFMETNAMDKCMSAGTHVMYKDGEHWKNGVVDSNSAEGVMRVSWRKSGLSEENLTWFELPHIAPVIHNEVYEEHNRDLLEAGKSGLLHNNAIEPRPCTIDNMLYQSESDEEDELVMKRASPAGEEHPTTNVVVDDPEKDEKSSDVMPLPPPPPPSFPCPIFMPIPPPMPSAVHPYPYMYLPVDQTNFVKMAPSFMSVHSFQSTLPHPRTLKKPGLSHSSMPCIASCIKSTNGIPPHPSSKFFQNLRNVKFGKQKVSSNLPKPKKSKDRLTKPPTAEHTQQATAPDIPSKHPEKIPKHKKHPKKRSPTAVEPEPFPPQTSHYSHAHMKHPTQPPNITTLPSHHYPPNRVPGKATSEGRKQHPSTIPRPNNPHHKPPRSTTTTKQLQSTSAHQPPPVEDNCHQPDLTSQMKEKDVWESDKERYSGHEYQPPSQRQSPDKGSLLEVVLASPASVTVPHGGSTLLTCVARSPRNVRYQWFKDSELLSQHNPFFTQPAPGMLQIEMASLSLAGEYKCVVSDNQDSFERLYYVKVCPDTQVSKEKGAGDSGVCQLQNTNSVPPQEPHTESLPAVEIEATSTYPQNHSPHKEVPIIVVSEPQPEPTSPLPVQTPRPLQSPPDEDMLDIGDKEKVKVEAEDATVKRQKVGEERKSAKRNRRRVSNPLKNDIELYLDGYGENYGALSATANLALEPWLEDSSEEERMEQDASKRKKRKRKKKAKKSSSHGSSSPTKSSGSLKRPKKSTKTGKLPSAGLGKMKTQVETENKPLPLEGWQTTQMKSQTKSNPSKVPTDEKVEEEELNSVAVHTSVGVSSGSEVSLGKGEDGKGGRLELPQEKESLNDSVRRLQLSVKEFCPEQLQFAEKEKKKGFLSSIFSTKNKLS